ncbi:unnamed protein product [Didymodactylos carnosus]|uniref:Uncharacterized protein n=1 Tax=Didymodactylos carnosus TaxID=1234261 RepID=A0A8S2D3A0_9BILA|nr:unnamed protein product [Didymodactylos carnosus]CAF3586129.1 unnamed protein product [Didymodactylos carnosus]
MSPSDIIVNFLLFLLFICALNIYFEPKSIYDQSSTKQFPLTCTCRNHLNQTVDWFIIYKLPRLGSSENIFIKNGIGYMYLDSSSPLNQWHLSTESITSNLSIVGLTLQTLYDNFSSSAYIYYNDQPPNRPFTVSYGHSKGVLAFDDQTGFWLIHTVPHFPQIYNDGYIYPDTGRMYGQTMFCITLNTTTPRNTIEEISEQFFYTHPLVYDYRLPTQFATKYHNLTLVTLNKSHVTQEPYYRIKSLETINPQLEILSFAKYGLMKIDIISELIAPKLQTNLYSETWSNGNPNIPSNCTDIYHTENIQKLSFFNKYNFTVHSDHSKWVVGQDVKLKPWLCIGDMNRQYEQKLRHGGFACFYNSDIQQRFLELIQGAEKCPI